MRPRRWSCGTLVRDGTKVYRYDGSESALLLGDVDYADTNNWTDVTADFFVADPANNRYDSRLSTSAVSVNTLNPRRS